MAQYGADEANALANWNNEPPQTILRIEQSRVDATHFIDELRAKEIEPVLHPASDSEVFLVVPRGVNVVDLPGFEQGHFVIQDPATVLSVDLLAPRPGEKVLDACAAPGGKTMLMAGRMQGGRGPHGDGVSCGSSTRIKRQFKAVGNGAGRGGTRRCPRAHASAG